ncbi:MAG: hypothetical protein AMJ53_08165 [Gammaproteobacteria bacterium SG8_11]|nr:MAG: hypothetical protein AMJ53_08165 [Gammaproteobacteria bacterium SG8_11]
MSQIVKYSFFVVVLALLSACDSESKFKELDQAIKRNNLNISTIVVESTKNKTITCSTDPCATYLPTNKTETFVARGLTPDGQPIDISNDVVWSTTDSSKAQVDQTGTLTTGTTLGEVDVIASFASIDGRAKVMVSSATLTGNDIKFWDNTDTELTSPQQLTMCDSFGLKAIGEFSDSTRIITHDVSWSANPSDNSRLTVNESNLAVFSSHTPAGYVVQASYQNDSTSTVSNTVDFNVVADNFGGTISISPSSQTIIQDAEFQFKASAQILGSNKDITNTAKWESGEQSIAKVDKGLVTGIGEGTTNIRVTCGTDPQTVSQTAPVTVEKNPALARIELRKANNNQLEDIEELNRLDPNNDELELIVIAIYITSSETEEDVTNEVTWTVADSDPTNVVKSIKVEQKSDNDNILVVTAQRDGVAVLTVKFSGLTDKLTVKVSSP